MVIRDILLFISCISLGGCSTLISEYISSQHSFGYEHIAGNNDLTKQGFTKSSYCSSHNQTCMSYLSAEPLVDKEKLNYQVSINTSGKDEIIQLQLDRNDMESYRGTVVLIHGFRASKEFMVNSALYFRFLGFQVIVPDLLGHGDSSGEISFGVRDSQVLDDLLRHQSNIEYPLFVVGNSMGAATAVHLLTRRNDVAGLILQAPMMIFDDATVNYINSYSPFISSFISDQAIRDGAIKALERAGVSLAQTDIKPIILSLKVPTLILASSADSVAPLSYFEPYQDQQITILDINYRSHPGMTIIGQEDNEYIQRWLKSKANK